jgi:hypothetical protein
MASSIHWLREVYIGIIIHSRSWALLEKPLPKDFPLFYGTRRFTTVSTRVLYWSLSWARSIQSISSQTISLRSILILSTHLRLSLPSCLVPSAFPPISYIHSSSPPFELHALLISFSLTWSSVL